MSAIWTSLKGKNLNKISPNLGDILALFFCNNVKWQNCLIEQDIYINNNSSIMRGTQWLRKNFSVTFTGEAETLFVDEINHKSFINNKIKLINGKIERL